MINEELLQFIREQRMARMETGELEHLLISEGGWDKADIDEAYRALAVSGVASTPTPIPPQIPTESLTAATKIAPTVFQNDDTSASSPASPMPHEPTSVKTSSNVRINLDKLLPGGQGERMLAQTKLSHDEFPRLFSQKTKSIVDESTNIPVSSPDIKTQKQSLESFFAMTNAAPIPFTTKEQPHSGTSPHPFSIPIAGIAASTPLKFDLAALRSKILPDKKESLAALQAQEEAVTKNTQDSLIQVSEQGADGKAKGAATIPVANAQQEEEKKKNVIFAKRTMISDLLSRESSFALPSTPIIPVQEKVEIPAQETTNNKNDNDGRVISPPLQSSTPLAAPSPFDDGAMRATKIKQILKIALSGLLVFLVLGGGVFAFLNLHAPDGGVLLSTAFAQFFGVSSFSYKGQMTTDLALSTVSAGAVKNGTVKFSLGIDGTLSSGKDGYGDGTHNIVFLGGWQWGDLLFSTDVTSDARVVENALYVRPISFPAKNNIDPELFRENWLKLDFFDIAQELRVFGVAQGTKEYGSFGGESKDGAFNALLEKSSPLLRAMEISQEETIGGITTTHIRVSAEPERMTTFAQALYRKYFNRDLTLSEDQLLRLRDALAKLKGDVWIDAKSGSIVKIVLLANFDDDIVSVHVQGPVSLEFSLSGFNEPVTIDTPQAALSLSDLKIHIKEYQKTKDMRARDQIKIDNVTLIQGALESYRLEKGRYPKVLTELYGGGKLATSSIDLVSLNDYFYRSYQKVVLSRASTAAKAGIVTKSAQCLTTGKVCAFYHLGVNLEDMTNGALSLDADQTTDILGADTYGCGGEASLACYDVISSTATSTISASFTPAAATTTTALPPPPASSSAAIP